MDELERRKRLDSLTDMFGSEGWTHLEEMLTKLRDQLNNIDLVKNGKELAFQKGRLMEVNALLMLPDNIRREQDAV